MSLSFISINYHLAPHKLAIDPYSIGSITSTTSIDTYTRSYSMSTGSSIIAEYQDYEPLEPRFTSLKIYTEAGDLGISITGLGIIYTPISTQLTEDDLSVYLQPGLKEINLTDNDDVFNASFFSDFDEHMSLPSVFAGEGSDTLKFDDDYFSSNYSVIQHSDNLFDIGKEGKQVRYNSIEFVEFNDTGRIPVEDLLLRDAGASLINAETIARLYTSALDRLPDTSGLNNWIDRFEQGMSTLEIADNFISSNEFQIKYGDLNNTEFITELYENVLDRAPDTDGLQNWISELDSGRTKANVLLGFSDSDESKLNNQNFFSNLDAKDGEWSFTFEADKTEVQSLARLYKSALNRNPDQSGINHWVDQYEDGKSLESIASQFIISTEFQSLYGNPDNEAFITLLYQNVLNRTPDADGYTHNLNALANSSREDMLVIFSNSAENIAATEEQFSTINEVDNIWYGF